MALIFGGIGIWPVKNFLLDGFWQNAFAWGTLFLFLAVPIIALITWLIRRMMRVRSTKQLSRLDLWWFMDIRMDISFTVCSQHGK